MFWIYLVIFVLIILIPSIIPEKGIGTLNGKITEELAIFLLGALGFLIFLWKEKSLNQHRDEKIKIQKEAKLISKDLTNTYLYIGEINRKLDILKNLTLKLPTNKIFSQKKEKDIFASIIEAIRLLGKSKNFKIIFIDSKEQKIIHEINGGKKMKLEDNLENINEKNINFINKDKFFMIFSPKDIGGICAAIIIEKKSKHQKIEDLEIIQVLISQALFLFIISQKLESRNLDK